VNIIFSNYIELLLTTESILGVKNEWISENPQHPSEGLFRLLSSQLENLKNSSFAEWIEKMEYWKIEAMEAAQENDAQMAENLGLQVKMHFFGTKIFFVFADRSFCVL